MGSLFGSDNDTKYSSEDNSTAVQGEGNITGDNITVQNTLTDSGALDAAVEMSLSANEESAKLGEAAILGAVGASENALDQGFGFGRDSLEFGRDSLEFGGRALDSVDRSFAGAISGMGESEKRAYGLAGDSIGAISESENRSYRFAGSALDRAMAAVDSGEKRAYGLAGNVVNTLAETKNANLAENRETMKTVRTVGIVVGSIVGLGFVASKIGGRKH